MDVQQIIALILVVLAALYVGRYMLRSARDLFSRKGGCGSGCDRCAFSKDPAVHKSGKQPSRPDIIPLADIRSLPERRDR